MRFLSTTYKLTCLVGTIIILFLLFNIIVSAEITGETILFYLFVFLYLFNFYQGIYLSRCLKNNTNVSPVRKIWILIFYFILALFQLIITIPVVRDLGNYIIQLRLLLYRFNQVDLSIFLFNTAAYLIFLMAYLYLFITWFVFRAISRRKFDLYREIEKIGTDG